MNIKEKILLVVLFESLILGQSTFSQTIEKENINSAEKIIGLEFTDAERDSMIDLLNEQLGNYEKIREIKLNNNVPPAILFNPIPIGFDFPKDKKPLNFSNYSYSKMPENRNEVAFYSIGELAELIRTKQITSTELTEFFIERLEKYDPRLHCVITVTKERAMKQAKLMDEEIAVGKYRGLLHGIPFGVKGVACSLSWRYSYQVCPIFCIHYCGSCYRQDNLFPFQDRNQEACA